MTGKRFIIVLLFMAVGISRCLAGPPYDTDDPSPTDYKHFEIYFSSLTQKTSGVLTGNPPLLEINYGGAPNLQLSTTIPMSVYSPAMGSANYGLGDIQLGAKYRFIQEDSSLPQIAFYPQVNIPTGNANKELGAGHVQVFLPLWAQKSWGKLQTYGGGGYWINNGVGQTNFIFIGWQAQYQFWKNINIGGEIFYQSAEEKNAKGSLNFNIGSIIDFSEIHHFVCAAGRSISGSTTFLQVYVGYLLTI